MAYQIDDKWFKQQQKRVGVTADQIAAIYGRDRSVISKILSGKQRMTLEWAKAFAGVLNVPLATVLEKSGVAEPQVAQQLTPGFAESDAVQWQPRGPEDRKPQSIAEAFGAKNGIDPWQVKGTGMVGAGLLPGDWILVDTFAAERVAPGDTVIAQVYNRNGTAKTVLRRWVPPVLVSVGPGGETTEVHVVDNDNVAIRGKVVACWRN